MEMAEAAAAVMPVTSVQIAFRFICRSLIFIFHQLQHRAQRALLCLVKFQRCDHLVERGESTLDHAFRSRKQSFYLAFALALALAFALASHPLLSAHFFENFAHCLSPFFCRFESSHLICQRLGMHLVWIATAQIVDESANPRVASALAIHVDDGRAIAKRRPGLVIGTHELHALFPKSKVVSTRDEDDVCLPQSARVVTRSEVVCV